jgi:hypothetical protein
VDNLGPLKDISIIVAGAIAVFTLWLGMFQHSRQSLALRAQQFVDMRRRFLENPMFREIMNLVAVHDPEVADKPIQDRRNLAAFFEEVALLVNSRHMKPEVAHYMFGYYAAQIDQCPDFWQGLDKEGEYWRVFREFVSKMEGVAERQRRLPRSIRV